MKDPMGRCAAGLLILTAAACTGTGGTDLDTDPSAEVAAALSTPIEVTLRRGEYRRIAGARLGLGFDGVLTDSRCPIDAVCVWMGDAVALIELAAPGVSTRFELHTSQEPRSAASNSVTVTLLELAPAPKASEPIRPASYAVRLRVERTAR